MGNDFVKAFEISRNSQGFVKKHGPPTLAPETIQNRVANAGSRAHGPPQPLPATERLRVGVAPVEHARHVKPGRRTLKLVPPRSALPCTCCALQKRSSVQQVHGSAERGGTSLSVRRPGSTCLTDRRDAHPQPLRGRQRLWRPMNSRASEGWRPTCLRAAPTKFSIEPKQ